MDLQHTILALEKIQREFIKPFSKLEEIIKVAISLEGKVSEMTNGLNNIVERQTIAQESLDRTQEKLTEAKTRYGQEMSEMKKEVSLEKAIISKPLDDEINKKRETILLLEEQTEAIKTTNADLIKEKRDLEARVSTFKRVITKTESAVNSA